MNVRTKFDVNFINHIRFIKKHHSTFCLGQYNAKRSLCSSHLVTLIFGDKKKHEANTNKDRKAKIQILTCCYIFKNDE